MAKKSFSRLVKIATGAHDGAETEFNRLERFAHFCVLVWKSFVRNRCPVRAAALSFTTLLAFIPLLAVAVSVTSTFLKNHGEERIYGAIDQFVSTFVPPATNSIPEANAAVALPENSPETNSPAPALNTTRLDSAREQAEQYIHGFIQTTSSGALGAVGMLLLISVAVRMLASIESTFNDIWGVTRGRSWLWRVALYWTTITLGPLLIVGALLLAGGPHLETTKKLVAHLSWCGHLIFQLLPLVLLWLVFALVYLLMPNTKVKPVAAFVGGMVGGTLWHLNNLFGFLYVSRVVMYSKIYGSLGLVPVFMVGVYFSWVILLLGAQVAYAFQNRQSYLQDKLIENVNQRGREFIALRLMTLIAQRFQQVEPPATLQQISTTLGIPTKLAQQVLQPLLAARLITEIVGPESAYLPARPLDAINAHHVLRAVRAGSGQDIATRDEPRSEVYGEFARIEEAERQAASSVTMLALVNRTQAPQLPAPPSGVDSSLSAPKSHAVPKRAEIRPRPSSSSSTSDKGDVAGKSPGLEPPAAAKPSEAESPRAGTEPSRTRANTQDEREAEEPSAVMEKAQPAAPLSEVESIAPSPPAPVSPAERHGIFVPEENQEFPL